MNTGDMKTCPRCLCDLLSRKRRNTLERLVFSRVLRCRMCGHVLLQARLRPIATVRATARSLAASANRLAGRTYRVTIVLNRPARVGAANPAFLDIR